jgi:hypothetical protein
MVDSTHEETIPEVQNDMVESKTPVDLPEEVVDTKKRLAWLQNTLRKLKDMQLPKAPLERARDHTSFPSMWH